MRDGSRPPLAGIRVVELAHVMAGPVCGRMLADMGADVVKVEPPVTGDPTRAFAPPRMGDASAAFVMLNRNKRGVVIDLKSRRGRDAVRRLLLRCDVAIENFRTGAMEKLGLEYESLRAENPGLVYCQITGYGRTGPLADRRGFDLIAQGMTGLMSVTGEGADRPPVKCGPPLTDITAGILGAMGVLAALYARERTGVGQRVDTSLYEAGIVQTFWQSAVALATGESPGPLGSAHPLAAPYEALPTADGWVTVGGWNQVNWLRLVRAVGLEWLAEDPRFASNADRMANLDGLREILAARLQSASTADWLRELDAANVPAGPVSSILDMLRHPQTAAREMVVAAPDGGVDHAGGGRAADSGTTATGGPATGGGPTASGGTTEGSEGATTLGMPVKFSSAPTRLTRGAPRMGEHTEQVLREHGFDEGEIAELIKSGAVGSLKPRADGCQRR